MMANPNPVLIYNDDRRFGIPTKRVRVIKSAPVVIVAPAVTTLGGA
jgi:hypothetical protein